MEWMLVGPLLAGLAALGLARKFPAWSLTWRAFGAGLGLFLGIWASNTFPALPPRVQTDFLAWGAVLPVGGLVRGQKLARFLLTLGLAAAMLPHPDWVAVLATAIAAMGGEAVTPTWPSRMSVGASSLVGAWAFYAGASARLAFLSVGWGLATMVAGGGTTLPLALLALIAHTFASLPDSLFLGILVLAAADFRKPVGWMAGAWVLGTARLETL